MRNEAFAFVSVILIIASAIAGYYFGSTLRAGTTTTSPFVPASCSTSVSASSVTGMIQVYQMTPGSAAVICLNYQFQTAGNFSLDSHFCVTVVVASSCALELTPSRQSFDHVAGQNVTFAYLIQADKSVYGVYWLGGVCSPIWIPIVVGRLPTSIEPPPPSPPFLCIYIGITATVTGVTNMNVSLVPYV